MVDTSPVSSLLPTHSEIEIANEIRTTPPYYPRANDFEASTSTSTSTAAEPNKSSSNNNYQFDIFINHRGPEMKKTFACHLYHRLLSHGLRAFLDYQEMQAGENITSQIKGAIAHASLHVAIFSPRYAESHWCLDELLLMLDSQAPIIPVFHSVTPADLRWTEGKDGVYARALRNLQEKKTLDSKTQEEKPRYHSNKIESWRKALYGVSEISGFELEACRDEIELLDKLAEAVLKIVNKPGIDVAKHPTGLEEKVKDLEDFLLQQPKGKAKVVGIIGLGGIGKTTLAKEFFNRKSSYYSRSCFLSDVREKTANGSLNVLQRELLKSLCKIDEDIDSVDVGKRKLRSADPFWSYIKPLIILDDVNHEDQIDALLPSGIDILPSNCLILITSRDRDVLFKSGLKDSSIYQLSGLNTQDSMELFCLHAFCQPQPFPGFQYLVDRILRVCKGLPLSIRVFGGLLSGNYDKDYWEDQVNRLRSILPVKIQQNLKITYDSLNREEQQIFLDIACFFIEEKRDTAITVWDQLGWKGSWGFQNLQNKCLVELDSENYMHMHDHLRVLGREIATDLGFFVPCLWDQTDNTNIDNLLQMLQQSSEKVRAIRKVPSADVENDGSKSYRSLRSDMPWFKKRIQELLGKRVMNLCSRQHDILNRGITMSNLQLLVTEDDVLERILRMAHLPDLRWLRWYKCGHSSLPSSIPMQNLRVLHVFGSAMKTLWQDKAQAPLQLQVLEICVPLSKFPKSIGKLKHLQQIYVSLPASNDFTSLPEEFCKLSALKRLELINAWRMKSLPNDFGNLTNLEHLNLSTSFSLERLPDSFHDLSRLKYLDLRDSHNLAISTEILGNILSLEILNLSRSGYVLHRLHPEILVVEGHGAVQSLLLQLPRSLHELHTPELPSNLENLRNLEILELEGISLEMLPPSLGDLWNLKVLRLLLCRKLKGLSEKIDGFCGLAKLQTLTIRGCEELEELPCLETLVYLEKLEVIYCGKLKRIPGLAQLTKLRLLDVSGCINIEELEGVEHLRSLEKLHASGCPKLLWDDRVLEQLPQRLKEGMLYT